MTDQPPMNPIEMNESTFSFLLRAAKMLTDHGMEEELEKMFERVSHSGDNHRAQEIIFEYVQTALCAPDPMAPEDIGIDPEFFIAQDGVTAYVETWFNTAERFGVLLGSDDSIDLYATYHPETEQFSTVIHIKWDSPTIPDETRPVQLLPSERSMILREMEQCAEKQHTSLKELYTAWKSEQGQKQTHKKKKEKNQQHER